jgi:hypothetical protein
VARQRRRGNGLFEAFQLLNLQNELIANPPVAPPRQSTPAEIAAKRAQATTAAYEKEYRERIAREDAESKIAQERGARNERLRYLGANRDEMEQLQWCPIEELPAALSDLRNAKGSPEIVALYDHIVKPILLK